jgi:hypothetical protein
MDQRHTRDQMADQSCAGKDRPFRSGGRRVADRHAQYRWIGCSTLFAVPLVLEARSRVGTSWHDHRFFHAANANTLTTETTLSLEREIGEHADLFVEYVGDYPDRSPSLLMLNSGGAWRFTRTQQLDFHVAFGLSTNAPHYIFGLGYSFRFDGLFGP